MYERFTLFLGRALAMRLSDLRSDEGQGVTEYALAVAFVVFALVGILAVLEPAIKNFIGSVATQISNLPGTV